MAPGLAHSDTVKKTPRSMVLCFLPTLLSLFGIPKVICSDLVALQIADRAQSIGIQTFGVQLRINSIRIAGVTNEYLQSLGLTSRFHTGRETALVGAIPDPCIPPKQSKLMNFRSRTSDASDVASSRDTISPLRFNNRTGF